MMKTIMNFSLMLTLLMVFAASANAQTTNVNVVSVTQLVSYLELKPDAKTDLHVPVSLQNGEYAPELTPCSAAINIWDTERYAPHDEPDVEITCRVGPKGIALVSINNGEKPIAIYGQVRVVLMVTDEYARPQQ